MVRIQTSSSETLNNVGKKKKMLPKHTYAIETSTLSAHSLLTSGSGCRKFLRNEWLHLVRHSRAGHLMRMIYIDFCVVKRCCFGHFIVLSFIVWAANTPESASKVARSQKRNKLCRNLVDWSNLLFGLRRMQSIRVRVRLWPWSSSMTGCWLQSESIWCVCSCHIFPIKGGVLSFTTIRKQNTLAPDAAAVQANMNCESYIRRQSTVYPFVPFKRNCDLFSGEWNH